jgi:hypothetical protein
MTDEISPLSLAVALGLVLDVSGALHVYGLGDNPSLTREGSSAALLLIIALLWLLLRPRSTDAMAANRRLPLWLALLPLLVAIFSIADVITHVFSGWTPVRVATFGSGLVALLVLGLRRGPGVAFAAVAFALGIALRFPHIKYIPLEPARGDMLPLVQQALDNLLRGQSPYTTYKMPWELPLTYFPLTWLSYLPAHRLGLDVRWTNVVAEIAILLAALHIERHTPLERRQFAPGTLLVVWSWIFLSPTMIAWDMVTSAPIGWAMIAWVLALVQTRRHGAAIVVLGLAVATTPLIAVVLPLVALCWWREDGFVATIRRGVLALGLGGLLLLPWFLWTPGPFLDGTVRWFNDLNRFPREKWRTQHTWAEITGFSGYLWEWRLEQWLKPIQFVSLVAVSALFGWRGARRSELTAHAVAAYVIFTLFNPVLWPYLYNPALVAAFLAVAGAEILPAQRTAGKRSTMLREVVRSRQSVV